ncbi:hypothetical protein L1275_001047 [Flavobacterium sp. HSC-61S13]|nr:hypothetical protein [Flavobacterium sp. HSC-61S13]
MLVFLSMHYFCNADAKVAHFLKPANFTTKKIIFFYFM